MLAASGLHQKQKTKQVRVPRKGAERALMQIRQALVFSYPPISLIGEQDPVIHQTRPGLSQFLLDRAEYEADKNNAGASLVAQWLRVCLPMQGTRVRALVWEDPTCRGATRPVSHNY